MLCFNPFLLNFPQFHFLIYLHDLEPIPFLLKTQLVVVLFVVLRFCVIIVLDTFHWNAVTQNPGLSFSSKFHLFFVAFVLYTLLCIISGYYAGVVRNVGS